MTDELFRADAYLKSCDAKIVEVRPEGIVLDRTVFYYESGGQPGDSGRLSRADGLAVGISDTKRDKATGAILHVPQAGAPALAPGDTVTAEIDWERRHRHMRMHTCLHLLCAIVPGQVTGGQIAADKGRLDFNVDAAALDKSHLDAELNRLVREDHPVTPRWITDEELAAAPDLVRTMSVKPPAGTGKVRLLDIAGVDLQPCGGTHVARTGEIGAVAVAKIENKGKMNRRVVIQFA
ncbi:MAG: alanyl-tRNA editing protein [Rhodospirillaceae bacterium]|nr:alanyl-tRNA editing protein [Rhodospirillaceae bacterium]